MKDVVIYTIDTEIGEMWVVEESPGGGFVGSAHTLKEAIEDFYINKAASDEAVRDLYKFGGN